MCVSYSYLYITVESVRFIIFTRFPFRQIQNLKNNPNPISLIPPNSKLSQRYRTNTTPKSNTKIPPSPPPSLPPSAMMAKLQPSDQLKQLKDIFSRFDMDHDGSLTQLELAALLRSLGLKPNGDQIHILLANIDANGNGSIEFDELVDAILPDINEQVLINQDQLMEVFRSFDRDGNGYITAAELAGQMAKMGHPLTYKELSDMMQEADTNGDGVISFNEFANILGKSASDYLGLSVSS